VLLDQISDPAPTYPYWHQRKYNAERIPRQVPEH
jgi:hypothetical protein